MSNASGDDTTQEIEAVSMKKPCDCCGVEMEVEHEDVDFCDACAARFSERIANHKTNCVWCGHKLFRARSPASGDDEELKALFDDVRDALNVTCDAKALHSLKSLESLFGRIKEERDAISRARAGLSDQLSIELADNVGLRAELGRIREAALTPEEAESLLWELDRNEEHPYFTFSGYTALTRKLKFISGGALKEGATQ